MEKPFKEIKTGSGFSVIQWKGLANGDVGTPFPYPYMSDRSIQVAGTFGVGGAAAIQGRNDPEGNFVTLKDPHDNDLSIGTARIEQIQEASYEIRPSVSGDVATLLDVTLLVVTHR